MRSVENITASEYSLLTTTSRAAWGRVVKPLLLALLIGLASASAAEQFILVDGRVIVGSYDPLTKLMRAQTADGVLEFYLEPAAIASQVPLVAPVAEGVGAAIAVAQPPRRELRAYYLREKQLLADQLIEGRRALYKDLGGNPSAWAYTPELSERLIELKRASDAVSLEYSTALDGERKRALGEQRSTLDRQYNVLLIQMKQQDGERSIVRERLNTAERIYREQLLLLEKGWIRDGHGQPPIQ